MTENEPLVLEPGEVPPPEPAPEIPGPGEGAPPDVTPLEPSVEPSVEASEAPTEPMPSVDPVKPGEPGMRSSGDRDADLVALLAYPFNELKEYAKAIGVTPARTKADTVRLMLASLYPPPPSPNVPQVIPAIGPVSVRVARISGQ